MTTLAPDTDESDVAVKNWLGTDAPFGSELNMRATE